MSPKGIYARPDVCPSGHPYDEENTTIRSDGFRSCRACARAGWQRRRAARRVIPLFVIRPCRTCGVDVLPRSDLEIRQRQCKECRNATVRSRYEPKELRVLSDGRHAQRRRYWSDEEIAELRELYSAPPDQFINVAEFARSHNREIGNVCRKAWGLGLTDRSRRTKPPRKPVVRMFATDEERRAHTSEFRRRWIAEHGHPRGALGMKHRPEVIEASRERSKKMWEEMTQEQLQALVAKRNKTNISRYGTTAPGILMSDNAYSRTKGGRRPDIGNQYFRSAWEANYARYLNFLVAQGEIARWEYEAQTFVFHGVVRGSISYTPDFRVTGTDGLVVFHEVKGWMDTKSKTKLRRMARFYPDVTIRVVGESEYRTLNRQCRGLIAGWE